MAEGVLITVGLCIRYALPFWKSKSSFVGVLVDLARPRD
jgi:hypothetical protein